MKKLLSYILSASLIVSLMAFAKVTADEKPVGHGDTAAPSSWAREYIEKAEKIGITENYKAFFTQDITREDFCRLAYNMMDKAKEINWKKVSPNPLGDTDNEKVISLYLENIIEGKGDGIFAPDDKVTRQEAATILDRIGKYFNLSYTEVYYTFDDENEISFWAMDSVQRLCNLGVMKGMGNGKFDPEGGYTTEQAIVTLVRMFDLVSDDEFIYMTFADKMYKNMPRDKNYMFSPLSVKMALLMAANGAEGETKTEILDALGIKDLDGYNENIRLMMDKYSESSILRLNIANSIWINSDKTPQRFSKGFEETLSSVFDATSDVVNDKTAVKEINGWVNEKTEGKIPTIISEDNKDFLGMILNAVYFKGRWLNEFSKGATKKDIFKGKDGSEESIDFMNKTAWMRFSEENGVIVTELPYQNYEEVLDDNGRYLETKRLDGVNVSMYLLMSDGEFCPEEVLKETKLTSKYVALSVPKFNIEYGTELNGILKTIGIKKAFGKDAEFSKMFDRGNMWIDTAIHKTFIKVDEEGTEAAAVTGIGMAGSALPPEPIAVKYDKPFTFVIKDNINGEILFMGEFAFAE